MKSSNGAVAALDKEYVFGVSAWSLVRCSRQTLEEMRRCSNSRLPAEYTPQSLKHVDEQSLASLLAVTDAIAAYDLDSTEFGNWAVVSAPRSLGRSALAATMQRFQQDGPWGASVQFIPQRSQHSVASFLSLFLKCHGPCVGVGGGMECEQDAILSATTLLHTEGLPGVWLTLSSWEHEPAIDRTGQQLSESSCVAVAIALTPETNAAGQLRIRNAAGSAAAPPPAVNSPLLGLLPFATAGRSRRVMISGSCRGGLSFEWELIHQPVQASREALHMATATA